MQPAALQHQALRQHGFDDFADDDASIPFLKIPSMGQDNEMGVAAAPGLIASQRRQALADLYTGGKVLSNRTSTMGFARRNGRQADRVLTRLTVYLRGRDRRIAWLVS